MNSLLVKESLKLTWAAVGCGALIIGIAFFWGLYVATQVAVGVLISIASTSFYALLAWTIIVKKNVAWIGPAIVIKYSILLASIYLVWVYCDVFLVLVGLLAQLIFAALFLALLKRIDSHGPL